MLGAGPDEDGPMRVPAFIEECLLEVKNPKK